MAKQLGGFLGPVVGKLGPMVGYLWRGRPVFRAYVGHIHYPNTARQQVERDWFISMVRFAAAVRPALLVGVHKQSALVGMTEGNYFVLRNKQHFIRSAEGVRVDYARLALSEGLVAPVSATRLAVDADGILRLEFEKNNGMRRSRGGDSVHLCVYNATLGRGLQALPVWRRDGRVSLRLPSAWAGHELHCYLFATDAQGEASATAYAGTPSASDAPLTLSGEGLPQDTTAAAGDAVGFDSREGAATADASALPPPGPDVCHEQNSSCCLDSNQTD